MVAVITTRAVDTGRCVCVCVCGKATNQDDTIRHVARADAQTNAHAAVVYPGGVAWVSDRGLLFCMFIISCEYATCAPVHVHIMSMDGMRVCKMVFLHMGVQAPFDGLAQ